MNIDEIIRKYALKNALDYGKANPKAVAGKVFAELPEARKNPKEVLSRIGDIVSDVNALSASAVLEELREKFPEMLEERKREESHELPPLPDAEPGKVVTRMPPEPNAYPHIGHAISFFFNWYYARKYDGKVILRFDDTNPRKEAEEYYDAMEEGLRWLGLDWDERRYMSDDMEIFYKYAENLIRSGKAYVCTCPEDMMRELRGKGIPCRHREQDIETNIKLWNRMLEELGEGKAVLRYKGDMKSKNTVMRDPTLARVVLHPHPRKGGNYRVWPTYDFACAIEDTILGITHVLRSNEFELRNELQRAIRDDLGLRQPRIIHYSRFNVEGVKASKRAIKSLIDEGKVSGWDDPRLVTLVALKRRGIIPEAIKELAMQIGLSTSQPVISWDTIAAINRKILDPRVDRYFLVVDPVSLIVEGAPDKVAKLKRHPSFPDRGIRELATHGKFFVSGADAEKLVPGDEIRLKDLYNIKIVGNTEDGLKAVFVGQEVKKGIPKIQWVPGGACREFDLVVPGVLFVGDEYNPESLKKYSCLGEEGLADVRVGEIVQLERVGFARKDSEDRFILAHK